jgi:hypothetical protein
MNKQLLSVLAFVALSLSAFAQCNPADYNWGTQTFGVSPNPLVGENFAPGLQGVPYTDVIYVRTPTTAADIDPTYPAFVTINTIHLDAVLYGIVTDIDTTWVDFAGLGLSVSCNNNGQYPDPCTFGPGAGYCGEITGTPNQTGIFPVKIVVTANLLIFGDVPYEFTGYTLDFTGNSVTEGVSFNDVVKVSPNPANEFTLVTFPMGSNEQAEVSVYNTMGQLVFSDKTMTTPGANTYRLNTADLPVGNYVARLVSGKNVAEKLIQVQH